MDKDEKTTDVLSRLQRTKSYKQKTAQQQEVILQALEFLSASGIPLEETPTRLERMAMSFLALANVTTPAEWPQLLTRSDGRSLKTRDIIDWINQTFLVPNEIAPKSSGSYDDIRREDLHLPLLAQIVVRVTKEQSPRNDPTRGYAISDEFGKYARLIGKADWQTPLSEYVQRVGSLAERLQRQRELNLIPVEIGGITLKFSEGEHNQLQKAIIEEFLPRFGQGAEVLYVGDTANRNLYKKEEVLKELQFFELKQGELPDVVAYSPSKNWLFLIEAFHSTGIINETRKLILDELTKDCTAEIIYVTAFQSREKFRKNAADIAWETEVWIADNPDHIVHYDGTRFLGPYVRKDTASFLSSES